MTFKIHVHHSGVLRAQYTSSYLGASAWSLTCLEVRGPTNVVLGNTQGQYDLTPDPIQVNVVAGQSYEVKFFACGTSASNISMTGYGGEIKHPS